MWQPKLPVLSSSFAYFGVLHMLHSDLLAQFTFPHLCTGVKLISLGRFCHYTCHYIRFPSNSQHLGYQVQYNKWQNVQPTYVLHCQSFALKRPRLFSARVLPISVPPAFIIFASVVLSVEHKENILKNTIFIKPFKKCTRFLNKDTRPTSATSVTTSSSGKIHISTPIKEQFHLLLTAVAWRHCAALQISVTSCSCFGRNLRRFSGI